jgi:hypothetical protein
MVVFPSVKNNPPPFVPCLGAWSVMASCLIVQACTVLSTIPSFPHRRFRHARRQNQTAPCNLRKLFITDNKVFVVVFFIVIVVLPPSVPPSVQTATSSVLRCVVYPFSIFQTSVDWHKRSHFFFSSVLWSVRGIYKVRVLTTHLTNLRTAITHR